MKKEDSVKEFQKKKYLERLKIFSKLREGKSPAYLYLVATLISLSVLIFFAIGPTIGTITELQKKLADSKMADEALTQKIANLNSLKLQYAEILPDLPLVTNAIPVSPLATDLMGRIQSIAEASNVTIERLATSDILLSQKTPPGDGVTEASDPSFIFSISVSGDYASTINFLKTLSNFDRVLTISSFSMSRGEGSARVLNIEGKAYYQP